MMSLTFTHMKASFIAAHTDDTDICMHGMNNYTHLRSVVN